jgi:hypothetical protein
MPGINPRRTISASCAEAGKGSACVEVPATRFVGQSGRTCRFGEISAIGSTPTIRQDYDAFSRSRFGGA